jgi:hypothetical protein
MSITICGRPYLQSTGYCRCPYFLLSRRTVGTSKGDHQPPSSVKTNKICRRKFYGLATFEICRILSAQKKQLDRVRQIIRTKDTSDAATTTDQISWLDTPCSLTPAQRQKGKPQYDHRNHSSSDDSGNPRLCFRLGRSNRID